MTQVGVDAQHVLHRAVVVEARAHGAGAVLPLHVTGAEVLEAALVVERDPLEDDGGGVGHQPVDADDLELADAAEGLRIVEDLAVDFVPIGSVDDRVEARAGSVEVGLGQGDVADEGIAGGVVVLRLEWDVDGCKTLR